MKHRNFTFDKISYLQLSELGSKFNLSFSSHLVLGNKIIGLDGANKRLLVSEINNGYSKSYIIELDKVNTISVKKSYNSIKPGELNKRRFEEFLKSIHLQFEFADEAEKILLPFYENETDNIRELPRLERNAKNWQLILSKMIGSQINKVTEEKRRLLLAG
jgi:hypothetical protein